jgi:hypothetical protein
MKQKKPKKICPNTVLCHQSQIKMSKKIRICKLRGLFAVTTRQLQSFIVFPHINILNYNILSQDMVHFLKLTTAVSKRWNFSEYLRV